MLEVAEAQARILRAMRPLPTELVPLQLARGRVLATPVVATRDQPPAAVSAMDGYAVRATDVRPGAGLELVGAVAAGQATDLRIGAMQAARIFTGGLVPEGADAILIQENAKVEAGCVWPTATVSPGLFVRDAGLDYRAGWIGLPAGRQLGPLAIGLAASLGAAWLEVRRRPQVGLIATGDELRLPGASLERHEIVGCNSFTLAAMVEAWGAVPVDLGIAPDAPAALAERLAAAEGLDLLVTSGGASVGDHDLVRQVAGERGLELDFWKIRMRPGKPLIFGHMGGVPLLGVPGNPVSAAVCGIVFLRGAVRALLGLDTALPTATARLAAPLPAGGERAEYLRGSYVAPGLVEAAPRQDSSMFATLAIADVLVSRPPHAAPAPAGAAVEVIDLEAVLAG
jgi:molybdopterin molybdotransferase